MGKRQNTKQKGRYEESEEEDDYEVEENQEKVFFFNFIILFK